MLPDFLYSVSGFLEERHTLTAIPEVPISSYVSVKLLVLVKSFYTGFDHVAQASLEPVVILQPQPPKYE